jgi:iron-sulfur cluster repair protein YtfE (RIC family)
MTSPIPNTMTPTMVEAPRAILTRLLPALSQALWDLELRYGADDEDLGRARDALDELQTDVALHLGEEAEFLMPLLRRMADGEQLELEELDRLSAVVSVLARRHDDFDGEISVIRDQLLEAVLPPEAAEDRAMIMDRLETLLERLRCHDRDELDRLFPAALADVHAQLVAQDEAEDRKLGWD